jgi:hypothetical protein
MMQQQHTTVPKRRLLPAQRFEICIDLGAPFD